MSDIFSSYLYDAGDRSAEYNQASLLKVEMHFNKIFDVL